VQDVAQNHQLLMQCPGYDSILECATPWPSRDGLPLELPCTGTLRTSPLARQYGLPQNLRRASEQALSLKCDEHVIDLAGILPDRLAVACWMEIEPFVGAGTQAGSVLNRGSSATEAGLRALPSEPSSKKSRVRVRQMGRSHAWAQALRTYSHWK